MKIVRLKYRLLMMICLLPIALCAQSYMVTRTVGSVTKVVGTGKQTVKVRQILKASDVVNIGAYSMLELLDEKGMKKISIKSPGQDNLKNMMNSKSNSVVEISAQYIEYLKSQVANQRQIAMSDPATITMQWMEEDSLQQLPDGAGVAEEKEPQGFRQMAMKEYEDFRKQCIAQYIQFVRNAWQQYDGRLPEMLPPMKEVPPVVYDAEKESQREEKSTPLPFDKIIDKPQVEEQPKPMARIPEVVSSDMHSCAFTFYGIPVKVRVGNNLKFKLRGLSEKDVADALNEVSADVSDNTIRDCLEIRYDLQMSDWAYLLLLRKMAEQACGEGTDEATLLTAYVFMQSGYKVRLASDRLRLYMLWASKHHIYGKNYFDVDGERYYALEELPMSLQICKTPFPQEKSLSLLIPMEQKFGTSATGERTIHSARFPELSITYRSNQNLMDFYSTYPTSRLGADVMTRWSMYANTPMQAEMKEQIYPALRSAIEACDEHEAVEKLLNLVQTGLEYEYDDKVWGDDRAFFAEESLFYPFCDCEDRSILFTRLVRDLCGLKCILVYYPGHLAAAVSFKKPVEGDYISLEGEHYTIADPTFIGASLGRTMPGMDNASATVILLE